MRRARIVMALALLGAPVPGAAADAGRPLVIGVFEAAPFATKGPDGRWHGLEVEIFEAAAKELGLSYSFREEPRDALLAGVADGSVDVVVAPVAVTAEREKVVDFSHIVLTSDLGYATSADSESVRLREIARSVLSIGFLEVVG
ncbi:MAG TPA: transporter substrate-binding domain-containing protein, partial [Thermoanaerobaculia bacterium]|nr:transporter substrate-binding domain-containing protein [Thermoanaerobaculia bacterium]